MLGTGLWFAGSPQELPNVIDSIDDFLSPPRSDAAASREGMLREALHALLANIEANASESAGVPVMEEEMRELIDQMDGHLTVLGQQLDEMTTAGNLRSTEQARAFVIDTIEAWRHGGKFQGATLRYAVKLRAGVSHALADEARAAMQELTITIPSPRAPTAEAAKGPIENRFIRIAVALVAGLVGLAVAHEAVGVIFAGWLTTGLAIVAGIAVGVVAFAINPLRSLPKRADGADNQRTKATSSVRGWLPVQQRLLASFSARLGSEAVPVSEECARLRKRLGFGGMTS